MLTLTSAMGLTNCSCMFTLIRLYNWTNIGVVDVYHILLQQERQARNRKNLFNVVEQLQW